MYCIGLTGNIASGKSTISALFKSKGIKIISADEIARNLTQINQPALIAIKNHFGTSVLYPTGELNRAALREKIFNDSKQREWLEQLLHPLIRQDIQNKLKEPIEPYVLIEIPLLYNRADYPYLDRVLVILANHELQVARLMKRDKSTRKEAEAILAVQADDNQRRKLADDILQNEGNLAELVNKVEKLHQQYLQFASQKP